MRFFDRFQGVPVEVALAASSAGPGRNAPITIGDRRYMDGGVAGTNIDGAVGYEVVVAITPFSGRSSKTSAEVQAVKASGGRVLHLMPDAEARERMGPDVTDRGRAKETAGAGLRQGREFLPTVRDVWR